MRNLMADARVHSYANPGHLTEYCSGLEFVALVNNIGEMEVEYRNERRERENLLQLGCTV